jgi:L-asparaginase/Glu-tRNA(Gln) amidotransferase subunit D
VPVDKNSPEVLEEHKQKVSKVSLNSGTDTLEKSETDTFDTFSYSTLKSSGEFSSNGEEKFYTDTSYYRYKFK